MRRRQYLADVLNNPRHTVEGEHETGQQDRGQQDEERYLDGLELGADHRGNEQPEREIGGDKQRRGEIQVDDAAENRHGKQPTSDANDQRELDQPDQDVGDDLADHQFGRADGRIDQQLEIAVLTLANDRD